MRGAPFTAKYPGTMTNPGRLKSARRNRRSASQMIVAGLLALAVIASLFLIFSDSVQLLRVGLVAALWAATVGAIAMTKYRRESALDKAKVNDLQTVYELQLEREISARREYELTVEKRVRSEVRADAEELAALRAELSSLRKNLEALFDGAMPTERIALRADSTRVQELAGGSYSSYQPAASGLYIPGAGHAAGAGHQSGSAQSSHHFANPDDDPVTAETSIVEPAYAGSTEPEIEVEPEPEPEQVCRDPAGTRAGAGRGGRARTCREARARLRGRGRGRASPKRGRAADGRPRTTNRRVHTPTGCPSPRSWPTCSRHPGPPRAPEAGVAGPNKAGRARGSTRIV